MKKVIGILTLVIAVIGFTAAADAALPITFTDTTLFAAGGTIEAGDYISHGYGAVNELKTLDHVKWAHQFTFDPPADQIVSGVLSLTFRDDNGEGDGGFLGYKNEYAFGVAEDNSWDFGELDTGTYAYDLNVDYLEDGRFEVKVCSLYGDFYLDRSDLEITYEPVPEPASMLMFGVGLVGLFLKKRMF